MYKRIKTLLLSPRNIANYVDEPNKYTVFQVLILMVLYAVPSIILLFARSPIDAEFSTKSAEAFKNAETIQYEIKDNELQQLTEYSSVQIVKSQIEINKIFGISCAYVFDISDESYHVTSVIDSGSNVVVVFGKKNLSIYLMQGPASNKNSGNSDGTKMANTLTEIILYEASYEKLGLGDIDFSLVSNGKLEDSKIALNAIWGKVYKTYLNQHIVLIIISILIFLFASFMLNCLIITLFEKLFYMGFQIKFGKMFKIVVLCSTPYVISCVLSQTTGLGVFEIIGIVLTVFYIMRCMTSYKLRFGGGIQMPGFLFKMETPEENKNEENKEEKNASNDDNENNNN